jgi:hypothetical protein
MYREGKKRYSKKSIIDEFRNNKIERNKWQHKVREDGRIVGGEKWQRKVYNREEQKMFLRTARNCSILDMPKE